jgi:hypothetical protein
VNAGITLAVMQPYFFPAVHYFQLPAQSDVFIFYDDVQFGKGGWTNRNRILQTGKETFFTVPVSHKDGALKPINNTMLSDFPRWRRKFKNTIQMSYAKAPHFKAVSALINDVLSDEHTTLSTLCSASVEAVAHYLELPCQFETASVYSPQSAGIGRQARLFHLCKQAGAGEYINSSGGRALYDPADFEAEGITLRFLEPQPFTYPQSSETFVPHLSVIDTLMHVHPQEIGSHIARQRKS